MYMYVQLFAAAINIAFFPGRLAAIDVWVIVFGEGECVLILT